MSTKNVCTLTIINKVLCPKYHCLIIAVNAYGRHWFSHSGISFKNYRSHYASSPALSKAINFDSIVEWDMQVCFENFQDNIALRRLKMYLLIDFNSSESAIQFASLKYRWILFISQEIFFSIRYIAYYSY